MARIPRKFVIDEDRVGIYHCINRCVRRAFLCGEDPLTGRNFDHRKAWIRDRLEFLAAYYGVEVVSFSVMSNHFHVVLRNRPDVVRNWSDQEVARRWWYLFPQRKNQDGTPAEPMGTDLQMLISDRRALRKQRQRLSSISWFMRSLAEPVARRANFEDEVDGRFWQGRFRCQRLLDEAAVLACCIYVDLNPIRAGLAETPESSRFTSAFERIHAPRGGDFSGRPLRDGWLSPVELDERRERPDQSQSPQRRASNRGCLPMTLEDYLKLLDWTGRQSRQDKRGAIPSELAPILERLEIRSGRWVETVQNFGRWFSRAVGRPSSMAAAASQCGGQWFQGIRHSREVFVRD